MRLPVQLADFQIQYFPDSSSWYCYRSSLYVTVFKHTTSNKPEKINIKSWSRNALRYLALVLDIPGCGWHRADTWNDRFPKWEKQRRKQSNSDIIQHYPKIIKNHPFLTYDSQLWPSLSGSPIDSRWFQYSPFMFIFCPVLPPSISASHTLQMDKSWVLPVGHRRASPWVKPTVGDKLTRSHRMLQAFPSQDAHSEKNIHGWSWWCKAVSAFVKHLSSKMFQSFPNHERFLFSHLCRALLNQWEISLFW